MSEGLPMFNMDLKSNGVAWAGNVYQKLEAMCKEVDGIKIQEKAKLLENQVQTSCDNVFKFCEEFMEDLLASDASDVDESVYDVPVTVNSKSPKLEEKMMSPAALDEFASSDKVSSPAIVLHGSYASNAAKASDEQNQEPLVSLEEAEAAIHKLNEHMSSSLQASLENKNEQHCISAGLDFVLPSAEIGLPNDFIQQEECMSSYVTKLDVEANEEFEDVKPENGHFNPDAEKVDARSISLQERKKRSFKKKLRDMFASRVWSGNHLETRLHDCNAEVKQHEEISIPASKDDYTTTSEELTTRVTSDSEWELL